MFDYVYNNNDYSENRNHSLFAAKLIDKKDWHMVEKVGGTSGDLMARGVCPKCDINLVGKEPRPRDFTLPCLIKGCTFNKKNNTKAIQ